MQRDLSGKVIVITGASSGIGRATALEAARRGASVVLAARREPMLREVAARCERLGGRAVAVPTDVTDEEQVRALAHKALEVFDRLDAWVNNAAVTLFGRFDETPPADYRRVIETNLFGTIYGARAVLPIFRDQDGGVLINVSSVAGDTSQPYTSAYGISKHGVRALGMALRQELFLEGTDRVQVVTVMLPSVDTPLFQHGANYTGREAVPIPPIYRAEGVARTLMDAVLRPRREIYLGAVSKLMHLQNKLAPATTERLMAETVEDQHFARGRPASPSPGNLFEPSEETMGISGGWIARRRAETGGQLVGLGILLGALVALVGAWRLLGPTEPPRPSRHHEADEPRERLPGWDRV